MAFGGALGDHQPGGDLLVGQPLRDQFRDLLFPAGQRCSPGTGRGGGNRLLCFPQRVGDGLGSVQGGATAERVTEAFKLILSNKKVKAILVNIFGGIVRCDLIAEGVVAAAKELGVHVPLVVRLQGTNAEQGRRILAESGLAITPAETLREAGERAVAAARGAEA